jgi:hypothetical protein
MPHVQTTFTGIANLDKYGKYRAQPYGLNMNHDYDYDLIPIKPINTTHPAGQRDSTRSMSKAPSYYDDGGKERSKQLPPPNLAWSVQDVLSFPTPNYIEIKVQFRNTKRRSRCQSYSYI